MSSSPADSAGNEKPVADVVEQGRAVVPGEDPDTVWTVPPEADPADTADQHVEVPDPDDDRDR
jgi:hypothetical protein